jgi:hypothetical protein
MIRNFITILLAIMWLLSAGCSSERSINGRNEQTAAKSVKIMKEYLPPDMRVEFELAYWTIRDALHDKKEFLDAVNGKTAPELIAAGRQYFDRQKAAGAKGYDKYSSWDEMVAVLIKERKEQSFSRKAEDSTDRANNILYKLNP